MLVSTDWLKEHISDPNLVILDTRPKTMFLYGHLVKSQSISIEQVIQFDQYGSNLVIEQEKAIDLFNHFSIDETKIVVLIGDSMDPSTARIAWTLMYFGHENIFLLDANASDLQKFGFEITRQIFSPEPTKFSPKINSEIRRFFDFLQIWPFRKSFF